MLVVNNLLADIDRRTIEIERLLDRDDGAINSGAISARCR
jgi:hypothetical protein